MTIAVARGARGQSPVNCQNNKSNMAATEWQEISIKLSFPLDVSGRGLVLRSVVQIQEVTLFVRFVELLKVRAGRIRTDYEDVDRQSCQDSNHNDELLSWRT